eukprot:CAMPEP_0170310330 /NCGR_PEP_ID=MMETSP0116_2-20130129/55649_1 /TAXON_ID=400756 /ORGANISM="Durinskia baltica, Strain CSIRO CS-38" /LENGTH=80 /DNA_ID=CAMNT_0010562601 /DNA_START=60 /DNA_END=298 /DNA_ORIENTATION=-
MEALKSKRDELRSLDDKFHDLRGERVRGETMYKHEEKVDVAAYVSKSKRQFVQRYEEGTFFELTAFAAKRGIKYSSIEWL